MAWAAACPLPFETARQRQRAKAVLKCLAQYASMTGRSWVTMKVFLVETDLGGERTVQRGLADLKAAGVIAETGEWETYYGRRYPVYQLSLDVGPRNTRERLQSALHDEDAADASASPGVSELSPQAVWGDKTGAPRGDETDGLGVSVVTPKEEVNPPFGREVKPSTGAREALFDELVRVCPRSMLRFADLPAAEKAWMGLGVAGEDLAAIVGALRDAPKHPEFKSRKHPPQLHDWLGKGMWRGWLPEPQLPLEASAPADATPKPPSLPKDVADVVFPAGLSGYLGGAAWDGERRVIVCRLGIQADEVRKRVLMGLRAIGVRVVSVREFEMEGQG